MPTKRRRVTRGIASLVVSDDALEQLLTGTCATNKLRLYLVKVEELQREWTAVREEALSRWTAQHPGTRPWAWWQFEAPRCQPDDLAGRARQHFTKSSQCDLWPQPRRRVGGVGTPAHEALNAVPSFVRGIPEYWVDAWSVEYYNGRARDVHGKPIGTEYHAAHFPYAALDDENPPTFESETTYLQRHGLLTSDEARQLHPDAFEPVTYDEAYQPFGAGPEAAFADEGDDAA